MLQQVGGDSRLAIATLGPCNHLAASRNEPVALDSHTKIWNKAPGQHCWVSYMSARSQTSQQISTGCFAHLSDCREDYKLVHAQREPSAHWGLNDICCHSDLMPKFWGRSDRGSHNLLGPLQKQDKEPAPGHRLHPLPRHMLGAMQVAVSQCHKIREQVMDGEGSKSSFETHQPTGFFCGDQRDRGGLSAACFAARLRTGLELLRVSAFSHPHTWNLFGKILYSNKTLRESGWGLAPKRLKNETAIYAPQKSRNCLQTL